MIKALEVGPAGRTLVCGLTWRNLDRLARGEPIMFDAAEVGIRPGFALLIAGGRTPDAIAHSFAMHGVELARDPAPDASLFQGMGQVAVAERLGRPLHVIGIAQVADVQLRMGGEFTRELPHGPALRLLAASSTDILTARLTADGPAGVVVDYRGGRTD